MLNRKMISKKFPKRARNHVNPFAYRKENIFTKFNNNKPIIVDIGSYRGEFGEELLKKFGDERNFIFFEIRKAYFEFLKEYFLKYENVKVYDGDAGYSLLNILKENESLNIEKIFINFPDPWFKKKHHKRRVINKDFLKKINNLIPDKTEIIFQTDQKKLFEDTLKIVLENGWFKIMFFNNSFFGIKTHWEEMKIKEGKKIYRMVFSKKSKNTLFYKIFILLKYLFFKFE